MALVSGTLDGDESGTVFNIVNDGLGGTVIAAGTWDGATIELEISPDGGTTWVGVGSDAQLTADGVFNYEFSKDAQSQLTGRITMSGSGTTDVDYWVV
jgi:hypothetical protein